MFFTKQDDYDKFKCIAKDCPKSCCKCWQIVIDDESLERYENAKGDFASKLKAGVDFEEGVFLQNGKDCSMLREDGFCDLQCNMGEEMLCNTCRLYPRHIEEFEDVREFSLSLSCPEAARMCVERVEPMTFMESENDSPDDFEDFDYLLYTKLVDAREIIYKIIWDRSLSIERRLELIMGFSRELQNCVDEERVFDMDEVIEAFDVKKSEGEKLDPDFAILFDLELLEDNWLDTLSKTKICDFSAITKREEIAAEQILILLVYTYFCGAVYDDEIYSKAALCVYSLLWIYMIYRSRAKEEDLKTLIEVLYTYAREVEHSDINLNLLEEYFIGKL